MGYFQPVVHSMMRESGWPSYSAPPYPLYLGLRRVFKEIPHCAISGYTLNAEDLFTFLIAKDKFSIDLIGIVLANS
jgi:hypothetical protein